MTRDSTLIEDFLTGARAGHGDNLRIDGDLLAVEMPLPPDWAVALRAERDVFLLRERPAEPRPRQLRDQVFERLCDRGLEPVTLEQQAFVEVAATIIAAIRTPDWQVWAEDADRGRDAIERILVGEPTVTLESPDAAAGATLDELLNDLDELDERLDRVARDLESHG